MMKKTFCNLVKKGVENNESVLVICDSATIALKVRNYLGNWNDNKDYFRLFTAEVGNMDDLINCNKIWKKRCVIMSPKIIYGLDVLVKYKKGTVIGFFKCDSIDSFDMVQQLGR